MGRGLFVFWAGAGPIGAKLCYSWATPSSDGTFALSAYQQKSARRAGQLALLILAFLILNCVSLTAVLHSSTPSDPKFGPAVGLAVAAAIFIALFVRARFSFGYIIGFNFYCLIASFLWLSYFTEGYFNRTEARLS